MTTRTPTSGAFPRTPRRSPSPSTEFVLTLWTNDAGLARRADEAGVDRVGVDLERTGKAERQRGLGTWLSPHSEEDLARVGEALRRASLFARLNPVGEASSREVEAVLAHGASVVMLPMVTEPHEAQELVRLVDGRARVVLLVEHVDALRRLEELVAVPGVDEVHIGLNDLALSLGLPNRWLVLAGDLVLDAGETVRAAGLDFGFGGIGLAGDDDLPVPSPLVYAEYARCGARAALLSRSFLRAGVDGLAAEVSRARRELAAWCERPAGDLAAAHAELAARAGRAAGW
jgi:hypothetical protein